MGQSKKNRQRHEWRPRMMILLSGESRKIRWWQQPELRSLNTVSKHSLWKHKLSLIWALFKYWIYINLWCTSGNLSRVTHICFFFFFLQMTQHKCCVYAKLKVWYFGWCTELRFKWYVIDFSHFSTANQTSGSNTEALNIIFITLIRCVRYFLFLQRCLFHSFIHSFVVLLGVSSCTWKSEVPCWIFNLECTLKLDLRFRKSDKSLQQDGWTHLMNNCLVCCYQKWLTAKG